MNILFLTMGTNKEKINTPSIYHDLLRKFMKEGHEVYVIYPIERRTSKGTTLTEYEHYHALGVKTLNVMKTNVVEKGIGQILLDGQFQRGLKKYFSHVKFDLILYTTPPISFTNVIVWAKHQNPSAKTYLMLKDIFPQNAVDLGMMPDNPRGSVVRKIKYQLYKGFRKKEKELYRVSDWIGCMSPANVRYVLKHNPEVNPSKVEICPNAYDINEEFPQTINLENKNLIRKKYNLPKDEPIFIYGGNMGKPQGIPFLVQCLNANKDRDDCHFLIVGDGFEYPRIEKWFNEAIPKAVSLFKTLPKKDYDILADACDVGMIFLDHRFTIPNYPSRLLPYLMGRKPILACTDPYCDTGTIAEENGYGLFCESNNINAFTSTVNKLLKSNLQEMGENAYAFYLNNYTIQHTYDAIMRHFE